MENQHIIYKVGPWIIDPDSLVLKNGDKEFKIQNKMMQVLIVLLEANGEVVSKNEFHEKVWTDAIVTQNSLNKSISQLRKILNHPSKKENYIETIPLKGYRVMKPILKEKTNKKELPYKRYRKNKKFIFSLFLFLALSSILFVFFIKKEDKLGLSLSPDGNSIAYYKKVKNKYSLFIENLSLKKLRLLKSDLTPQTFVINWSPNGEKLIYNATRKKDPFFRIRIVSLEDEKVTTITFAKDEEKHQTESVPKGIDPKLLASLETKEIKDGSNIIHHVYLTKEDTIKIFLSGRFIKSFSW